MAPSADPSDVRRQPVVAVELLFPRRPALDLSLLEARLRARRPASTLVSEVPPRPRAPVLFAHPDLLVEGPRGRAPAMSLLAATDVPVDLSALEPSLAQTWDWPDARAVAAGLGAQVLVGELAPVLGSRKERLELFLTVLAAAVEALEPSAIHLRTAQKLVEPTKLLEAVAGQEVQALLMLAVNVRLHPLGEQPEAMLMDTIGLAPFGLPDLQVRFRELDPRRVAAHLYNCAGYLFERGAVIEEGQALTGLSREGWVAHPARAAAPPDRPVLDLDPGPLHTPR